MFTIEQQKELTSYSIFAAGLLKPDLPIRPELYCATKLFAETGEFMGKVCGQIYHHKDNSVALIDEAGDCWWYWFNLHALNKTIPEPDLSSAEHSSFEYLMNCLADKAYHIYYLVFMEKIRAQIQQALQVYSLYMSCLLVKLGIDFWVTLEYNRGKLRKRLPGGVYNQENFNTLNRN